MVRISSGRFRSRLVRTIEGEGYRPATAMVREALFSALEARGVAWEGLHVLDLFAGSGSLALEALSRGAARAVFVESGQRAVNAIRKTCKDFQLPDHAASVIKQDVARFLDRPSRAAGGGARFDVVFIDPPYGQNLLAPALQALLDKGWTAPGAVVAVEVEARLPVTPPSSLTPMFDRLYGQTRIIAWTTPAPPATSGTTSPDASPSTPAPSTP